MCAKKARKSGDDDQWEELEAELFGVEFGKEHQPAESPDAETEDDDEDEQEEVEDDEESTDSDLTEHSVEDDPEDDVAFHAVAKGSTTPPSEPVPVVEPPRGSSDDTYWDTLANWSWDESKSEGTAQASSGGESAPREGWSSERRARSDDGRGGRGPRRGGRDGDRRGRGDRSEKGERGGRGRGGERGGERRERPAGGSRSGSPAPRSEVSRSSELPEEDDGFGAGLVQEPRVESRPVSDDVRMKDEFGGDADDAFADESAPPVEGSLERNDGDGGENERGRRRRRRRRRGGGRRGPGEGGTESVARGGVPDADEDDDLDEGSQASGEASTEDDVESDPWSTARPRQSSGGRRESGRRESGGRRERTETGRGEAARGERRGESRPRRGERVPGRGGRPERSVREFEFESDDEEPQVESVDDSADDADEPVVDYSNVPTWEEAMSYILHPEMVQVDSKESGGSAPKGGVPERPKSSRHNNRRR